MNNKVIEAVKLNYRVTQTTSQYCGYLEREKCNVQLLLINVSCNLIRGKIHRNYAHDSSGIAHHRPCQQVVSGHSNSQSS